jgi:hypothetical protein
VKSVNELNQTEDGIGIQARALLTMAAREYVLH